MVRYNAIGSLDSTNLTRTNTTTSVIGDNLDCVDFCFIVANTNANRVAEIRTGAFRRKADVKPTMQRTAITKPVDIRLVKIKVTNFVTDFY